MWPFKKKKIILSNKKYIDYLPVGTIIKIYDDSTEYMIYRYLGNACMAFDCKSQCFRKSKVKNNTCNDTRLFYHADYAIQPYPTGNTIETIYIMHEDIEKIIYLGYNDSYRENILKDIDVWNSIEGEKK